MRNFRTVLVATIFFSLLAPQAVQATGINKTSCKSKGSIRIFEKKKYLCTKSGKKLIWIQTKFKPKVPPSNSEKTQKPEIITPYTPWADPINPLQISSQAQLEFKNWINAQSINTDNLLISVDPSIKKEKVNYLIDVVRLASKSLLGPVSAKPHMYISVGDAWIFEAVKKDYPLFKDFQGKNVCYPPNPIAACAGIGTGFIFFVSQSSNNWDTPNEGILSSGAHEFFHLAQGELSRNQSNEINHDVLRKLPSWFFEGSATFMGTAYADLSEISNWNAIRKFEISAYSDGRGRNEPISSFINNEVDRPQPEGQSHRPYGIGFLACELIVASVGIESFLDIYRKLGLGQSFEMAFKESTGIELQDFYNKFDSMRTKIGFFPVIYN